MAHAISGTGTKTVYSKPQLVSTTTNWEKSGYSDGTMPTDRSMSPKKDTAHDKAAATAPARGPTARSARPPRAMIAIGSLSLLEGSPCHDRFRRGPSNLGESARPRASD